MSVINKMLRDLDSRQTTASAANAARNRGSDLMRDTSVLGPRVRDERRKIGLDVAYDRCAGPVVRGGGGDVVVADERHGVTQPGGGQTRDQWRGRSSANTRCGGTAGRGAYAACRAYGAPSHSGGRRGRNPACGSCFQRVCSSCSCDPTRRPCTDTCSKFHRCADFGCRISVD